MLDSYDSSRRQLFTIDVAQPPPHGSTDARDFPLETGHVGDRELLGKVKLDEKLECDTVVVGSTNIRLGDLLFERANQERRQLNRDSSVCRQVTSPAKARYLTHRRSTT